MPHITYSSDYIYLGINYKVKNSKFLIEKPYILAVYLNLYHKELWEKSSCGNNLFYCWQLIFSLALPNCNFSRKPLLTRLILSFNFLHMLDFQRKYLFYNLFWIFLLEIRKLCFLSFTLWFILTFTVNHSFYITNQQIVWYEWILIRLNLVETLNVC